MISILTNLLLVSAALAAPHLDIEARVDKRLRPIFFSDHLVGASYLDNGTEFAPSFRIYSAVSAVLLIPTNVVIFDNNIFSAWVQIDGHTCPNGFQSGINALTVDGKLSFNGWFSWTAGLSYYSSNYHIDYLDIKVGEAVRLSVTTTSPKSGIATIENLTRPHVTNQSFYSPFALCQAAAEWMVSIPKDNTFFGFNITFSEVVATTYALGPIGPNGDSVQLTTLLREQGTMFPSVDSSNIYMNAQY